MGGPFIVGALADHMIIGMWVGLATLLLAAGEREGTYRLNFTIVAVSTPIAAVGYVLGFSQGMPLAALVILASLLALLMGLIAGLGPAFSVAGMQFLLVSSIAMGVDGIDWWLPLGLYFAGAALYAALLAVEMLIDPVRPQRQALEELLTSLAVLVRARRQDLAGGDGTAAVRARASVTKAYVAAKASESEFRWSISRARARGWCLDRHVTSSAERVSAFVLAEADSAVLAEAESRLQGWAENVAGATADDSRQHRESGRRRSPLDVRLDELGTAIWATTTDESVVRERRPIPSLDSEVVLAATRLAVCFGIAVAAKAYFPFSHWFWVPLTVALVMKPDFGSVFSRAILRVAGTVIGVLIATVLILLVPKGVGYGVAIAVLAATVPWMMLRSYAFQAIAIAPIVILLVAIITPGDGGNYSWQRIAATLIGAVVVIVFGYLLWPHSRRQWVRRTFAQAMNDIADHLQIAESSCDDGRPGNLRHDELLAARRSADRALDQLRSRLLRALAEPGSARTLALRWLPVADAADRLAADVTSYAAQRAAGTAVSAGAAALAVGTAIRGVGEPVPRSHAVVAEEPGPVPDALQPIVADIRLVRTALAQTPPSGMVP